MPIFRGMRSRDRIEIEAGGVVIRLPGSISASRLAEIVAGLRTVRG